MVIVLILVVVGHGLVRSAGEQYEANGQQSLNPCCSWTWTSTKLTPQQISQQKSLNPCCSWTWTSTQRFLILTS